MIQIDRKLPPEQHKINKVALQKPLVSKLNNNIPVYILESGIQDVVRIDFIFSAGSWYESKPLIAKTTNAMLSEGTKNMSAFEIAEKLEYYGSFIQFNNFYDYSDIVIYSLKKHIAVIMPVIEDIIKNSVFPEKELQIYLKNSKQNFLVNKTKVQNLSREKFLQVIFGQNHPYGKMVEIDDYNKVLPEQLFEHYNNLYNGSNCKILISGKIDDNIINIVNEHFGNNDWTRTKYLVDFDFKIEPAIEKQHLIFKEDAIQSALRIGKNIFNISHPDYFGMSVLNKILGGYFGSRLMTNIREDKGYTYGIGSMIVSLKNEGYFVIASEVASEVCKSAIKEIYYEINKLKNEPVGEEELNLVKNYILGQMLRSFDGPFNLANSYRTIIENELKFDFYDNYIYSVNNIKPIDILKLAEKYFNTDNLFEVIAGKY